MRCSHGQNERCIAASPNNGWDLRCHLLTAITPQQGLSPCHQDVLSSHEHTVAHLKTAKQYQEAGNCC
jgi:hypothetical protein